MSEILSNQYNPDYVSPPGETLAEILEERQIRQVQFAGRTGRTPKFVNEIIKGKASISPDVAIEFERVLGIPSSFWNERQRHYDAFLAREREVKSLEEYLGWEKSFPYSKMSKWQWVPETKDKLKRLSNLLDFFGVANPVAWERVWQDINVAFRKSASLEMDQYGLAAWLRKGELEAHQVECGVFNRDLFFEALTKVRPLTIESPDVFVPRLKSICSSCGVVVAFVPELPRIASGATRWLSPHTALIQLSLRYKSDDHLWFTFFHEAAHILHHSKKSIFIETGRDHTELEEEANRFAADFLIPKSELKLFISNHRKNISKSSIVEFATRLGISPGIVVGRLQHDKFLMPSHCNDLKKKLVWR